MLTRGDKFLIILIIILSIISLFLIRSRTQNISSRRVLIKVDGEIYREVEISNNMEAVNINVETSYGYNLVNVDRTGARVLEASCKDKLDVKQGSISNVGEIIVCLPNKVTVEIVGDEEPIVDGISG